MPKTMSAVPFGCLLVLAACDARAVPPAAEAPKTEAEITAEDVQTRVDYLACEGLCGRLSTDPGAKAASQYIADEFARIGLEPAGVGGTWFQPYEISLPKLGAGNELVLVRGESKTSFTIEKEWNPFSPSPNATAEGDVVFAGYGITWPEKKYDDYEGVDVKGKVVLVLRHEPPWSKSPSEHAPFVAKLGAAVEHGAAAILIVNDPRSTKDGTDPLVPWSASLGPAPGSAKIPFAFVASHVAAWILGDAALEKLQKKIDEAKDGAKPASFAVDGARVRVRTAMERTHGENTRNVAGLLTGSDPALAPETVVLGAHYDHVGRGEFGGSAGTASDLGKIHPGADDNASGTAVMLEVAEAMAAAKERPKRSVLFLAFSGEELGLLGSAYYVEHPLRPLADVETMVNLDMVGRLDRKEGVEVGGVGTGEGLQPLVEEAAKPYTLTFTWDPQGLAPTDSTSFFVKKVPVLWFFTGLHPDYHTPRDTPDKLEAKGAAEVGNLTRDVVVALANREKRIAYTTPPKKAGGRPVLGITPAESGDAQGVPVKDLAEDGPAAKAGMKAGDVVKAMDAAVVGSVRDLVRALAAHHPGDEVLVKILREGAEQTLRVTLGSR